MKYLSSAFSAVSASILASALVMTMPLDAIAGIWGLEEQFADRENVPHSELVESIYQRVTPIDYQPGDNGVRAYYEALFEPEAVEIPVRTVSASGDILNEATLYYSQGDLFYLYKTAEPAGIYRNFATVDGELYTWPTGASTGQKLTRFTGDTTELLDYIVDFSLIKRSAYGEYLDTPESFEVNESDGVTTLKYKDGVEPFVGIQFVQEPLWLSSLIMEASPNASRCDDADCHETARIYIEVAPPIPLSAIPSEVQTLPEEVTFEPSEQTADTFMVYL